MVQRLTAQTRTSWPLCRFWPGVPQFGTAIEGKPRTEAEKYILYLIDIRDEDGRDGITPLVVLGERQAVALIKAKDKGLKAIRLL